MPIKASEVRDFLAACRRFDRQKVAPFQTRQMHYTDATALDDENAPGWVDAGVAKHGTGLLYSTLASFCSIVIIQAGTKAFMAHVSGSGELDVQEVTKALGEFFATLGTQTKVGIMNRIVITICTCPDNVVNAPLYLLGNSVGVILESLIQALQIDAETLVSKVAPTSRVITGLSGQDWTQHSVAWVQGSDLTLAFVHEPQ